MYIISNNSFKFKKMLIQNKLFFSADILNKLLNLKLKIQSEKLMYNLKNKNIFVNKIYLQKRYIFVFTFGCTNILQSKLKKVHIYYDKNMSKYGKIKYDYLLNSREIKENINVCIKDSKLKLNSKNIIVENIQNISCLRSIDIDSLDKNNLYIFTLFDINKILSLSDILIIPEAKYDKYIANLVDEFLNKSKDILVLPGDVWNRNCYFSNFLIREGANVILNINDLNMYI